MNRFTIDHRISSPLYNIPLPATQQNYHVFSPLIVNYQNPNAAASESIHQECNLENNTTCVQILTPKMTSQDTASSYLSNFL